MSWIKKPRKIRKEMMLNDIIYFHKTKRTTKHVIPFSEEHEEMVKLGGWMYQGLGFTATVSESRVMRRMVSFWLTKKSLSKMSIKNN